MTTAAVATTPYEWHGATCLKRDDLYEFGGVRGGKVRTCEALGRLAQQQGCSTLVTAGSRHSPQVEIVAHVAAALGLRARCHVPAGAETAQLRSAAALGATVLRHRPGHNSVIVARARADAAADPAAYEIPFGMECEAAVQATASQVVDVPAAVQRIVVPVGSGMSLAGITRGVADWFGTIGRMPIVGVRVGADPVRRLDRYAHPWWHAMVELVQSPLGYHEHADASIGGVRLDPVYEAKCVPYLQPGDLLWCVGIRSDLA